jgi:hypothetical protein
VLLVLGAVLPGALLTGFIVRRTLEQNRTVLENRLADTARVDAAALDREFTATIRVLETLAQSPSLDAGDLKTFWSEAQRAARTQPGWYAVILLTPDSELQLHSEVPYGEPLVEAQNTERVRQVEETRKPVVGQLARGRGDKLHFPISVPVDRQGQMVYVLTALIEPQSLVPVIRTQLPETEEWTRAIVDPGLLIAARSRGGDQFIGRPVTAQGRDNILNPPARPIEGTSLEGEELYSSLSRSTIRVDDQRLGAQSRARRTSARVHHSPAPRGARCWSSGGLPGGPASCRDAVSSDFEAARDAAAALAGGRTPAHRRNRR